MMLVKSSSAMFLAMQKSSTPALVADAFPAATKVLNSSRFALHSAQRPSPQMKLALGPVTAWQIARLLLARSEAWEAS
jgi:hypothetical protein